jgi:hypothetical protein
MIINRWLSVAIISDVQLGNDIFGYGVAQYLEDIGGLIELRRKLANSDLFRENRRPDHCRSKGKDLNIG